MALGIDELRLIGEQMQSGEASLAQPEKDRDGRFGFMVTNSRKMGLKHVPVVAIYNKPEPNAMVVSDRAVAITSGMMAMLSSPDELEAAMTHELAHIKLGHQKQSMDMARNKTLTAAYYEEAAFELEADKVAIEVLCRKEGLLGPLRKLVANQDSSINVPLAIARIKSIEDMRLEMNTSGKGCSVR